MVKRKNEDLPERYEIRGAMIDINAIGTMFIRPENHIKHEAPLPSNVHGICYYEFYEDQSNAISDLCNIVFGDCRGYFNETVEPLYDVFKVERNDTTFYILVVYRHERERTEVRSLSATMNVPFVEIN